MMTEKVYCSVLFLLLAQILIVCLDTLDVPTGDNEIQNRADSAATVVAVGDRRTSADNAKSEK